MRIQCDVCEKSVAAVMCCADEAALCTDCDTRVHAANKLANKHQRVSLITGSGDSPRCDICQEKSAFFFCLEDRALLCRDCDVSIHSATARSSAHQRFLVPGTKVALEALNNNQEAPENTQVEEFTRHPHSSIVNNPPSMISSPSSMNSPSINSNPSFSTPYNNSRSAAAPTSSFSSPPAPVKVSALPPKQVVMNSSAARSYHGPGGVHGGGGGGGGGGGYASPGLVSSLARRTSITEFLSEAIPNWRVDELLNIPELADGYSLGDVASSKADVANLGDYDWTADLSLFDEQVLYAESLHEVPQMGSPSTAPGGMGGRIVRGPGAMKGKAKQGSIVPDYDDAFVVPDLGLHSSPASPPIAKRRRQFVEV